MIRHAGQALAHPESAGLADEEARDGRLLGDAEIAAGQASLRGGDAARFASSDTRRAARRQQQMELLIRRALAEQEIGVAYQPVFDLTSGVIVGAEALLRLNDADGSPVPALDVVSAAESSELIVDLGNRVLRQAARQAAQWQRDHGLLVPIAVNVCAVQLGHPAFTSDVLGALGWRGCQPRL